MVEAATIDGDVEGGVQFIGQAQGLVDDVPSAEAESTLAELAQAR